MTARSHRLALMLAGVAVVGGVTFALHTVWFPQSELGEITPHPPALMPPEPPMDILVSCERGNQSGETNYRPGDIPQSAIFVRCRPYEDFTYDVSSTEAAVAESNSRAEVAFVLTDSGQARYAVITHSSGSKSLDQKVLRLVSNRKYKPTGCGTCRVVAIVPVDMKKR